MDFELDDHGYGHTEDEHGDGDNRRKPFKEIENKEDEHNDNSEECSDSDSNKNDGDENDGDESDGDDKSDEDKRKDLYEAIKNDPDKEFMDETENTENKAAFFDDVVFKSFYEKYHLKLEEVLFIWTKGRRAVEDTVLHHIVNHRESKEFGILKLQLLARLILTIAFEKKPDSILVPADDKSGRPAVRYSNILSIGQFGKDEETCLHQAVRCKNVHILQVICYKGFNKWDDALAKAIATPSNGQTCLHAAIKADEEVNLDLLELLLEKSDDRALLNERRGGTGNTPLHDLVDAERCKIYVKRCPREPCAKCKKKTKQGEGHTDGKAYKNKYIETLRILVERCPKAMVTTNKADETPYLFNKTTRAGKKILAVGKNWRGLEFDLQDKSQTRPSPVHQDTKRPADPALKGKEDGGAKEKRHQKGEGLIQQHGPTTSKPNPSVRGRDGKNPAPGSTAAGGPAQETKKKRHQDVELEYFDELAAAVARFLLERAFSQHDYANICKSLLGNMQQLSGPKRDVKFISTPLTEKTTVIRGSMALETILAYVELDLVLGQQSEPAGTMAMIGKNNDLARGERRGREKRVTKLFEWLRKNKSVKRIVKLSVDDDPHLPCEDATIKKCLEGFDIRCLDWNKEDIYIPTLKACAPNVRELWLSWSGRGSTLLGWASKDGGLRTLEQLNTIHLSVRGGVESEECTEEYLERFKRLLNDSNPNSKIVVLGPKENQRENPGHQSSASISQVNDFWAQTMRNFTEAFERAVKPVAQTNAKRILVGVIDDGVSLEEFPSGDRFQGWESVQAPPAHKSSDVWYYSTSGHGTKMVQIIQQICPHADFFIGKLDTRTPHFGSVAASAAKAIDAAVKSECDIITMSWSIYGMKDKTGETDTDNTKALDAAIHRAIGKDIILYCAGQDQGHFEKTMSKSWPGLSTNKMLKKIGCAKFFGEGAESVNLRHVDYLFPGTLAYSGSIETSSSAATARAAGVAALILWCTEVCRARGDKLDGFSFRRDGRMNKLFDSLRSVPDYASIVDITGILNAAAAGGKDCPRVVFDMCRERPGVRG